ncbi:MAG: hypothetical protein K5898_07650 [Ruminococcus sp.]|uniref:hypothetical protein n=1 Tax=Ruminococcus sp. TaxID=41978 RepID=UPI0025D08CA4|nr:hypothetical protein [Ruminococcus sp.]MCR4795024.1 hypothetical protein [Ruminococcus sp.]
MKKGLSSNSSPKTFSFIFSQIGHTINKIALQVMQGVPYLRKNQLKKSLERGSGKSLSSERFSPIITYIFLYQCHGKG